MTSFARSSCGDCKASIVWSRTVTGKMMPVDADPVAGGNVVLDLVDGEVKATVLKAAPEPGDEKPRYRSHFVTCSNSAGRRKPR